MYESKHSISLLFNANNVYDRQILEGIGHYLHTTKVDWDVFLEEDFRFHGNDVVDWRCDGLIANYDDLEIKKIVGNISAPVIGVGCSYSDLEQYPNIPYVASDNFALVESAFKHLKEKGLKRFAMYSVPLDEHHRWVIERERALAKLASKEEYSYQIYKGHATNRKTWHYTFKQLSDWIENLPKPIGIIAVNDARARHLLQACDHLGVEVPERVSIIGIDNDDLARNLSRISLSSVTQGCFEMGYKAAKLLHRRLEGKKVPESQVLVGPVGVEARQSTEFKALSDIVLMVAKDMVKTPAPLYTSECWGAVYTQGQETKVHNHWPFLWSWCYYVKTPDGSSPLVFPESKMMFEPNEGELIIFSSLAKHYVPPCSCEDKRIMIAGNIGLQEI